MAKKVKLTKEQKRAVGVAMYGEQGVTDFSSGAQFAKYVDEMVENGSPSLRAGFMKETNKIKASKRAEKKAAEKAIIDKYKREQAKKKKQAQLRAQARRSSSSNSTSRRQQYAYYRNRSN